MSTFNNFSTIQAEIVVSELIKQNITQFYVSPGKRNLPIINALTNYSKAKIEVCIDERTAAFMAIGFAQKQKIPSVLICTSGSALAHYYPAVLEAKKTAIPLIILSADRPKELIHVQANQTIDQNNFFNLEQDNFFSLEVLSESSALSSIARRVSYIGYKARSISTPIHINVSFSEPLDRSVQKISKTFIENSKVIINIKKPYTQYLEQLPNTFTKLLTSKTTAVVVGAFNEHIPKGLSLFLKNISNHQYCDITALSDCSNNSFHPDTASFENLLQRKKIINIIHIGGRLTSNCYYKLLNKYNISITHLDTSHLQLSDPSFQVRTAISIPKLPKITSTSKKKKWKSRSSSLFTHYEIANTIWHSLPSSENIFIGNSMTIRAFDLITKNKSRTNIFFQRGVSGIDGNISHATGIAHASKNRTSLVIGDIAFFHDIGVLSFLASQNIQLTIFVVNNNQGGIFNLLKLADSKQAQELISTPHSQSVQKIVESFGIAYCRVSSTRQLQNIIKSKRDNIKIIELVVDQAESQSHYEQIILD